MNAVVLAVGPACSVPPLKLKRADPAPCETALVLIVPPNRLTVPFAPASCLSANPTGERKQRTAGNIQDARAVFTHECSADGGA